MSVVGQNKRACLSPALWFFLSCLVLLSGGCDHYSYPEERIHAHLQEICKKEYGIDHVESKIVGKTIGVYLPLEKIFSSDFEEILAGGKIKDMSSLLQISPETLDKVEDVLFSTSRVVLSTDKPLDFYVLKATDTEITGITLILVGYVQDIKRVRFWDISRTEYRKRVYHDLKVNYPVIWKKPVVNLLNGLGKKTTRELLDNYFLPGADLESISPLFYSMMLEAQLKEKVSNEVLDIRSTSGRAHEALIYAKVREDYTPKPEYLSHKFVLPSGFEAEYIFILAKYLGDYKVSRIIPFHYATDDGSVHKIDFPPELKLYESVESWQEEFELEEIFLEKFLADQIARRVQSLLSEDERIQNTFASRRISFRHIDFDREKKGSGYFSMQSDLLLKKPDLENTSLSQHDRVIQNEDVRYLLDVAIRELVTVLRGYWYEHYEYVELESVLGARFVLRKPDLDLYRRKKIKIDELLKRSQAS